MRRMQIGRLRQGTGLSPRMRGNQTPREPDGGFAGTGLIPAHAGEPTPRMRGNQLGFGSLTAFGAGLSPRMRGNPWPAPAPASATRSIPAHAGEPNSARPLRVEVGGLSPRMRGNLEENGFRKTSLGSIPAHAGEPEVVDERERPVRVYPRACGGTIRYELMQKRGEGLSPRMRGNPHYLACDDDGNGSIPAHAGEPHPAGQLRHPVRVYPRACGGTCSLPERDAWITGLSPRMRGTRSCRRMAVA